MKDCNKSIAIVPGSFDPITNGHLNIAQRAAQSYDKVYVAVMINSSKEYMFTLSQRERIARAALSGIDNIEVISSDGMLWELARDLGACAIVKGYRNQVDLQYEKEMADYNNSHYPQAKTVLLEANSELSEISSTVVRKMIIDKASLEGILPEAAIEEIYKIMIQKE